MITESDELAKALDTAARIWPEHRENRSELLRQIVRVGTERIENTESERVSRRKAAIEASAGRFRHLWPSDWRDEMRDEWPA